MPQHPAKGGQRKLAVAIQRHHDAGEEIAPPDDRLVKLVGRVAQNGEKSEYTLTNTWQVASYVIADHVHQAKASQQDRTDAYRRLETDLTQNYLGKSDERGEMLADDYGNCYYRG